MACAASGSDRPPTVRAAPVRRTRPAPRFQPGPDRAATHPGSPSRSSAPRTIEARSRPRRPAAVRGRVCPWITVRAMAWYSATAADLGTGHTSRRWCTDATCGTSHRSAWRCRCPCRCRALESAFTISPPRQRASCDRQVRLAASLSDRCTTARTRSATGRPARDDDTRTP